MKKQGVESVSEPIVWPEARGGWTLCFLCDPDGNLIELVQPPVQNRLSRSIAEQD